MKRSYREINLLDISQTEHKSTRSNKIKTTDVNILLNRVRMTKKIELKKRVIFLASLLFGVILIYINGLDIFSQLWMNIKLALVVFLTIYHEYLGICLKSLKLKTNTKTSKFFRIINEVPTIILILIIFIVIFKPI